MVHWVKMELFKYMSREWVRVKWLTLSEPNGTPMGDAWCAYEDFAWSMSKHYKTHLHFRWGADWGYNSHAHFIVSVPLDELNRFEERDEKFKEWSKRPFKQVHYEDFVTGYKTEGYACEKHTSMEDRARCPRRTKPCKRGDCSHDIVGR